MHADPSAAPRAQAARLAHPSATGFDPAAGGALPPAGYNAQGAAPAGYARQAAPSPTAYGAAPQRLASPLTGAYMPSGDPTIDRMVALERALKQYGSPI